MPHTVSSLRSLLSARFPERGRSAGSLLPAGAGPLDEALGGGLAAGRLTELVSGAASSGGQTVLASLLESTQGARRRVALVDGSDAFAPGSVRADLLCHLVWVRCSGPEQAFAAADILVRDANYAAVVIDLRGCAERALRRTPASVWYRLQRAAETGPVAVLVQTTFPLVPAVPARVVLGEALSLADTDTPRASLAARLSVRPERSRTEAPVELAG